jgi:hypothetical protein
MVARIEERTLPNGKECTLPREVGKMRRTTLLIRLVVLVLVGFVPAASAGTGTRPTVYFI